MARLPDGLRHYRPAWFASDLTAGIIGLQGEVFLGTHDAFMQPVPAADRTLGHGGLGELGEALHGIGLRAAQLRHLRVQALHQGSMFKSAHGYGQVPGSLHCARNWPRKA